MRKKIIGIFVCMLLISSGMVFENTEVKADPGGDPGIGYELIDDNTVLHIWNEYNSYYFNTSSGIQLTNHKDDYWSHNILMLGYYDNDVWNLIYRTDELSGFNKDIDTDNETFVNATIWKDLSYSSYEFRLAIRYHLGVDDIELTVIPYIKNLGSAIPYTLGFGWEIKDIQIDMTYEKDWIRLYNGTDWTSYLLNQTLDNKYTDMDYNTTFYLEGRNEEEYFRRTLYLKWDHTLDYLVWVKNRTGQYNAPVTLFIKVDTLGVGQEKYTEIYWHDSDDWLGISGSELNSHCGDTGEDNTLYNTLSGEGYWDHSEDETHWFILDLGQNYTIKKFRGRSITTQDPISVDIYISIDNSTWGTAVASDISTWQDTAEWEEVNSTDKTGRYVKVEITSTETKSNYLKWGETEELMTIFDVYGDITINTSVDMISPYNQTLYALTINASGSSSLDNVTLWYRYSLDNSSCPENWWNLSWPKRTPVYLNVSTGETEENHTVLLNVTYDADINVNFSDLRFIRYADNTTLLDYWIENKSDGNWCKVWVEFRDNITSMNQTLAWMYFGNFEASSLSDGADTFLFFDDFSGSTLNSTRWPTQSGNITVNNSEVHFDFPGTNYSYAQSSSQGYTGVLEFRSKYTYDSNIARIGGLINALYGGTYLGRGIHIYDSGAYILNSNDPGVYHKYKIVKTSADALWYFDDVYKFTRSKSGNISTLTLGNNGEASREGDTWFDYIFTRKYAEPTYSIGVEQNSSVWMVWNNSSNPDTSSPWSWEFDFPHGGYYEFYSIGRKSGIGESPPEFAEVQCHFPTRDEYFDLLDTLPHYLNGTILDGSYRVVTTENGSPPPDMTPDDYDYCINYSENENISETARQQFIGTYGIDPYPPEPAPDGLRDAAYKEWLGNTYRQGSGGPHEIDSRITVLVFPADDPANKPYDLRHLYDSTADGFHRFHSKFQVWTWPVLMDGYWDASDVTSGDIDDYYDDLKQDCDQWRTQDNQVIFGWVRNADETGRGLEFWALAKERTFYPHEGVAQHEISHCFGGGSSLDHGWIYWPFWIPCIMANLWLLFRYDDWCGDCEDAVSDGIWNY